MQLNEPAALKWPEGASEAFQNPIGSAPLHQIARGAQKVAIIVSDASRGIPTAKILPFVVTELTAAGVRPEQITVVVATGVHRPANSEEISAILGPKYAGKLKVLNHQPFRQEQLKYLGETSFGTPVEVNKTVWESDFRIAIGKVEPHEFAGFSGGRKSVLPGISSEKTIEINHRPEMLLHPEARPGELEKNPISLDMLEAAQLLGINFIVNLVLNSAGEIIGLFTGSLKEAHLQAVQFMRSFCQFNFKTQPDIIVTTPGRPLNIDFYQSIKPLIALGPVMKAGNILVLYSACTDGMGTEDMLIPYEGATTPAEVIERLKQNYKIQMDHALLLCKILQKGVKVVATSPRVPAETLRRLFIEPAATPQQALEKALAMTGKTDAQVVFFPQPQRALVTNNSFT